MFVLLLGFVFVAPEAWSLSAALSPGDHTATLQFAGRERSARNASGANTMAKNSMPPNAIAQSSVPRA